MALASKFRDEEVVIIDELGFSAPKTKDMAGILQALNCHQVSVLVATADHDLNVYKSARNIARVTVSPVANLNAWSILTPRKLVLTRAALDAIKERAEQRVKADHEARESHAVATGS
jgi:large subunit ribosomal protein L4